MKLFRQATIAAAGLVVAASVFTAAAPAAAAAGGPAGTPPTWGAAATLLTLQTINITHSQRNEDFQMFGEVHIGPGEVHPRDLVVIGGKARVEGEVRGEIVVVMGELYLSGTADRDVVTVLSKVQLDDGAVIEGSYVNVLGSFEKHGNIDIDGDFVDMSFIDLSGLKFGGASQFLHILQLIKAAKLALLFVIIIIIAALAPKRVEYAGNAFASDWPRALLFGLAAYIFAFVAIFVLCITIIGIPVAIALGLAMKVAKWMGYTSIFYLVGDRVGRNLFSKDLSLFPSILIGYVVFGFLRFLPLFVGEMIWMALAILAVGLSLSTRFGSGQPWFGGRPKAEYLPGPPPPVGPPPATPPPPPPQGPDARPPGSTEPGGNPPA